MFRAKDRELCQGLQRRYYPDGKFHDAFYREVIRKHLPAGGRLLDAGCGRHLKFSKELAKGHSVFGIDLESTLETPNQCSPFGVRGNLNNLPFPSSYFDLVISRFVLEHLEHPLKVFHEFCRVLKPGGKAVLLTPNKYDYVSVIAIVTPYSFHRALCTRIFRVPEDDVFPTFYRANTPSSLGRALRSAGFIEEEMRLLTHYPAYLAFSPLLFRVGVLYERLVALRAFRMLRAVILCVVEKQQEPLWDSAVAPSVTSAVS
jgi:SAM-dependent methyltransferase